MLKKLIFLAFYIVLLKADDNSIELGLYQELIYKYSPDNCPYSCMAMYNHELCGIKPYTIGGSCDGQVMACESLGKAIHILAMAGGLRKILRVLTMEGINPKRYESLGFYNRQDGFFSYGEGLRRGWEEYKDHHCHCRCVKDHFRIYVGELKSWEEDNYVIIGLRFHIVNDVFYLQMAQGLLEANGTISEYTWTPPPYNPSNYQNIDVNSPIFFLDELTLDLGYALTGVKFEFMEAVNPKKMKGFGISISGVPFDYETGRLNLELKNRKIIKASPLIFRRELQYKLVKPFGEISLRVDVPSPSQYNYVTLRQSELKSDFGQNTLPLFSNDSVMISPLSPLTGIGLFHNGTEDDSGFISLRLYPAEPLEEWRSRVWKHRFFQHS